MHGFGGLHAQQLFDAVVVVATVVVVVGGFVVVVVVVVVGSGVVGISTLSPSSQGGGQAE